MFTKESAASVAKSILISNLLNIQVCHAYTSNLFKPVAFETFLVLHNPKYRLY